MSQLDILFQNLAQTLSPYSEFIGSSVTWLGLAQMISPGLVLNRIRKNPENNKIPVFPFLFVAMHLIVSVRYAQIINDDALYETNLKGFTLSVIYLSVYFYLCTPEKKKETLIYISSGSALVMFIYYYSINGDPATIQRKYETIMTSLLWTFHFVASIGVFAGYAMKTSDHLGFEMIVASGLMGINRTCYAVLKDRRFQAIQGLVFLLVQLGQLSCFILFGSSKPPKKTKSEKKSTEKPKKRTKKD